MNQKLLVGIVEKVGWTFVQAFLVSLLAFGPLGWSVAEGALAAGVAAVITLALNSLNAAVIPVGLPFYADLGLRVARSSAAAFLAFLVVEPAGVLSGRVWDGALAAAGMAALVALKGGAARFFGDPNSAATLPAGKTVVVPVDGYSPNDDDPDAPTEPGDRPDWIG